MMAALEVAFGAVLESGAGVVRSAGLRDDLSQAHAPSTTTHGYQRIDERITRSW